MSDVTQVAVDSFVDAGMLAREVGVLPRAAGELAAQLLAEGHGQALAEITAAFWSANSARLAHRDRWAAYEASLDKTGQEPPPPPPPPDPEPQPEPEPEPPKDSAPPAIDPSPSAPTATGTGGEGR